MRASALAILAAFLACLAAPNIAAAYDYCSKYHDKQARERCEWDRHHHNTRYKRNMTH